MFINNVNKKEEIRNIAIRHLRKHGIKFRDKYSKQCVQVTKCKKFIKVPLQSLENETVTLKNGQQLVIPKQLYEICSFICSRVETEGIFRKEGSKSRQNEIKLLLDRGCLLGDDHHVIDVAVVLKYFLRELPEPLIPYSYHELFLRCSLVERKVESIMLACLLLPSEHLNVLSFLMQFLNEVANHAKYNKMNTYNIAILVGPNIFPVSEKLVPKNKLMVTKICDIIKLMIEHSRNIGVIPDYIIEQIHTTTDIDVMDRTRRRRSGSLTRIFNGLKKFVGNRPDEETTTHTVTPDLLLTPCINSSKKDEERSKAPKKHRQKDEENITKLHSTKTVLERRWSAITHATNFKRKKRNSSVDLPQRNIVKKVIENIDTSKADYVKVSKKEYEEIKNRVSAIEKRLSLELENVQSTIVCDNTNMELNNIIQNIQSAYEQTLVHSEPLSSGTDQIARRLSRELRIRNSEQKMIRSPSARKIGNMRRRSRELEKPSNKGTKNHFHFEMKETNTKLIRNIPSTASDSKLNEKYGTMENSVENPLKQSVSFHSKQKATHIYRNSSTRLSFNSFDQSPEMGANESFSDIEIICDDEIFSSYNPNKFDNNLRDAVYVNTISKENLATNIYSVAAKHRVSYDSRTPQKTKPVQEKGITKFGSSPVRKNSNLKSRGKYQEKLCTEIKRLCKSNKENDFVIQDVLNRPTSVDIYTPKIMPHIKRPMIVKSPKRLCSTPQNFQRNTPVKVLAASNYYSPGVY